jgi:2-oxo-4-hydroxy-4-carboxy-5-ureidoimidazoline decarboxylase
MSIEEFNGLTGEAALDQLRGCCSAPAWMSAVAAARPYRSADAVLTESDAAVARMSETDLRAALAGHPQLGERTAPASWSSQEQAAVSSAGDKVRQELAAGNAAYQARFGHIYLACATGRSAAELVDFLRERLGNDRETEWQVVAAELAKINRIRLGKLIGASR